MQNQNGTGTGAKRNHCNHKRIVSESLTFPHTYHRLKQFRLRLLFLGLALLQLIIIPIVVPMTVVSP